MGIEPAHYAIALKPQEILAWVRSCRNADGGFGGGTGHDSHMLYTLSAVQLLALCGALGDFDAAPTVAYVAGLQVRFPLRVV